MALAYRSGSVQTAGNSSGGALTITKPTGTASGDVLVAILYLESDTNTWTPPSGFTSAIAHDNTGAFQVQVFTKVAGGSEPANYTFTPGSSNWRIGLMAAYSGGTGTGTLVDVTGGNQGDATVYTSQTAPTVTTTGADRMLIFGYGNFSSTNISSLTGAATSLRTSFGGLTLGDALRASAGATGTTRTATDIGSQTFAAVHVALISDTGGGGAQTIGMNAIAAGTTLYNTTVAPGAVSVATNAISAATTLYQPAVTPPAQAVATNAISAATSLAQPAVATGAVTVGMQAIAAASALYQPAVSQGGGTPQSVGMQTIAAGTALAQPSVAPGAVVVATTAIASGTTLQQPAVTPGAVTAVMQAIASGTTPHQPAVAPGSVTVAMQLISNPATLQQPAVAAGTATIAMQALAAATALYAPAIVADQDIATNAISVTVTLYEPQVGDREARTVSVTGSVTAVSVTGSVTTISLIGTVDSVAVTGS